MFELKKFLNFASFRGAGAPLADFDRILNWKLLRGSHEFPGPDGGTCVNEAAIVAAGHPYRAVRSVEDCPASFSLPAATYAMFLNDLIEDDETRKRVLMPFVTRLDHSADIAEIEKARAEMMVVRTASQILAPAFRRHDLVEAAERLRAVASAADVIGIGPELFGGTARRSPMPPSSLMQALSELADAAYACLRNDFASAAKGSAIVAANVAKAMQRSKRRGRRGVAIYRETGVILDAVLKVGNRGRAPAPAEAAARLERVRRKLPAGLLQVC